MHGIRNFGWFSFKILRKLKIKIFDTKFTFLSFSQNFVFGEMDPFPRLGLIYSTLTWQLSLFHYFWMLKIIPYSSVNNHSLLFVSEPSHQGFSFTIVMIHALWVKCSYFVSLHNCVSTRTPRFHWKVDEAYCLMELLFHWVWAVTPKLLFFCCDDECTVSKIWYFVSPHNSVSTRTSRFHWKVGGV